MLVSVLIIVPVFIVSVVLLEFYLQLHTVIGNVPVTPRTVHAAPVNFTITAYTCGPESTGKTPADPAYCVTSSGYKLSDSDSYRVAAVDPKHYVTGTVFYVYGVGWVVAVDTGGDIVGHDRMDLFVGKTDVKSAINFGRRELPVFVYKNKEKR